MTEGPNESMPWSWGSSPSGPAWGELWLDLCPELVNGVGQSPMGIDHVVASEVERRRQLFML